MVTLEELKTKNFTASNLTEKASFHVTSAEMKRFESNVNLATMVYKKITDYANAHNIKPKYTGLEELCQISETSFKKSCAGSQKITRTFLYKLAVGLKMNIDEANKFFFLCGGALREDNLEDYICIKAIKDKDDILHFIEQFNEFTIKMDKHQSVNRLKRLDE